MVQKPVLAGVDILIVDSDYRMAQVFKHTLEEMGFQRIQHVASGSDALRVLHQRPVDLLITEWQTGPVDGLSLAAHLRGQPDYHHRSFPVMMLTGRAERSDVEAARDAGITEYIAKPFNSRTLFGRLESVTDHPRATLATPHYVGPDRRRKANDALLVSERRETSPVVTSAREMVGKPSAPQIVAPDFALKQKMGLTRPLSSVITPAILAHAQSSIDALKEESLAWLKADITDAEQCYKKMQAQSDMDTLQELRNILLSIKSRAGTFGYRVVSDAADISYRFLRNNFTLGHPQHIFALSKCLEAIRALLVTPPHAESEQLKGNLVNELRLMGAKFQQETL